MLVELDPQEYKLRFKEDPHPFISKGFVELNRNKVDKIVWLSDSEKKPGMGIVSGIRDDLLLSPFSAPFGGFHFRKEIMLSDEIDQFIISLKEYIKNLHLKGVELIIPPDVYHQTINAKVISALIRNEFTQKVPEITNWVDLHAFTGKFTQKNSKEYYKQAVRNGLRFLQVSSYEDQQAVYKTIYENRKKFRRPIYMTLQDIIATSKLWETDFFKVLSPEEEVIASAIMYRGHPEICYAVFWGDSDTGRPLRAMDFLVFHLWNHYKALGFKYLDLGTSTEDGVPNKGLLRFKESHEASSSLKYRFSWYT